MQGGVADVLPGAHQIFVVALDLGPWVRLAPAVRTIRPMPFGTFSVLDDGAQALAVGDRA